MKRLIYIITVFAMALCFSCRGRNTGAGERHTDKGNGGDTTPIEATFDRVDSSTGKKTDTSQATFPTDTATYKRDKKQ